ALHMILAAYAATGFGVAGIHALLILRGRTAPFHKYALRLALLVGVPAAILQPISGDVAARHVAVAQPAKLAAAEALFVTQDHAPLELGGFPDMAARVDRWGVRIPAALSLLAFHDPSAQVTGLDRIPADQWPNVPVVHLAFDVMVGIGTYLGLVVPFTVITLLYVFLAVVVTRLLMRHVARSPQ